MQHETATSDNQTNNVTLTGTITTEVTQDNQFYLSVPRLSGMADNIPIVLSEEIADKTTITPGQTVSIKGQFHSHNKIVGDRSKLMLCVYAEHMAEERLRDDTPYADHNPNLIEITGYICKAPIYRTTPFNREIADLLIAVNRMPIKSDFDTRNASYERTSRSAASDYLPAIAWGRNARFSKNLLVGEKVSISGRIQSREYQKRLDDGTVETRTAFEVSINSIARSES